MCKFHLKKNFSKLLKKIPRPDQNMDILNEYIHQTIINKNISVHCVTYEINNHIVNV